GAAGGRVVSTGWVVVAGGCAAGFGGAALLESETAVIPVANANPMRARKGAVKIAFMVFPQLSVCVRKRHDAGRRSGERTTRSKPTPSCTIYLQSLQCQRRVASSVIHCRPHDLAFA